MKPNLFGTDGVRGMINKHPLTPEMIVRLGMAAGVHLMQKKDRNRVIIAKDTRLSGYLVETALTSAFLSIGIDVILVGPMPTPAVPILIKSLRANFGVMISASHNPYYDNGLKLFNNLGFKLDEVCEKKIEELIEKNDFNQYLAAPDKLGKAKRLDDAPGRYIEYVKSIFPKNLTLSGYKIVIDSANGGAYRLAPTILWELGAEVISIGCEPNGFNINDQCGSMAPEALTKKVLENKADIGIALDGDADRIVICDEKGKLLHGDCIIGIIAAYLKKKKKLKGDGVVTTHISNSALENYLKSINLNVWKANIGDKHVSKLMRKHGCNLGGEQSGHIIFGDYTTTGDGIIAALQILALLVESGGKMSDIGDIFKLTPQLLNNVNYQDKNPLTVPEVRKSIDKMQIDHPGVKILVRKSGTEKVIRILVEGKEKKEIGEISEKLQVLIAHNA